MFKLTGYALTDFLLFTEDTYLAMMAYYQHTVWPVQVLAVVFTSYCFWQCYKRNSNGVRHALLLFAVAWVWLAVVYQKRFYAEINWLAHGFAVAFFLQALLLLWLAWRVPGRQLARQPPAPDTAAEVAASGPVNHQHRLASDVAWRSGLIVFAIAGVGLPSLLKFHDRPWDQLELIFVTPDATALATIALLMMLRGPVSVTVFIVLLLIPVIWCLTSLLTLLALAQLP